MHELDGYGEGLAEGNMMAKGMGKGKGMDENEIFSYTQSSIET